MCKRFFIKLCLLTMPAASAAFGCDPASNLPGFPQVYPARAVHLSWSARSAFEPCAQDTSVQTSISWSSTHAARERYLIDGEFLEYNFQVEHVVNEDTIFTVRLPFVHRTGGTMDGFIDSYHDWLSLPEGNRDEFQKDRFLFSGEKENGEDFFVDRKGGRQGNVEIWLKEKLDTQSAVFDEAAVEVRTSLPTSSDAFGHRGVDLGLGLLGSSRSGNYMLDTNLALLYFGRPAVGELDFKQFVAEAFFRTSYSWSASTRLSIALSYSTEALTGIIEHPQENAYMDFGLHFQLEPEVWFDVLLREDLISGYGASDVGVMLALRLT